MLVAMVIVRIGSPKLIHTAQTNMLLGFVVSVCYPCVRLLPLVRVSFHLTEHVNVCYCLLGQCEHDGYFS